MIAIDDGNASGIVAAIFKATQPIEQDGGGLRTPDITDNSAHISKKRYLQGETAASNVPLHPVFLPGVSGFGRSFSATVPEMCWLNILCPAASNIAKS